MTNEQETHYIHQLLDLMKDRSQGYYVGDEGIPALGYGMQDYPVLMRRLKDENLATVNYETNMLLTSHGLTIARETGGYKGYLAAQQRQQLQKSSQEARSAQGSFLSGWAGVGGLLLAAFSIWDAHHSTSALENRVAQLERAHTRDSLRVLATPAPAATLPKPTHHNQASTPSTPDTSNKPAPTPRRKPAP